MKKVLYYVVVLYIVLCTVVSYYGMELIQVFVTRKLLNVTIKMYIFIILNVIRDANTMTYITTFAIL